MDRRVLLALRIMGVSGSDVRAVFSPIPISATFCVFALQHASNRGRAFAFVVETTYFDRGSCFRIEHYTSEHLAESVGENGRSDIQHTSAMAPCSQSELALSSFCIGPDE